MADSNKLERELEQKRQRVLGGKGGKTTGGPKKSSEVKGGGPKKSSSWVTILLMACALVAVTVVIPRLVGKQASNGGEISNGKVPMVEITATVSGGKISVPLQTIKDSKLVRFIYERPGATEGSVEEVPVLAYVAPSGKIVTAVSVCEPCNSTTFFIEGKKIVCTSCGTQWDVESLKGIAGGCTAYPPDKLDNTTSGDAIQISEEDVVSWKSRI